MIEDISTKGLDFIKSWEKFIPHVYKDAAGLPTIGYGHLIKPGESYTTITEPEAVALMKKDLQPMLNNIIKSIKVDINQNQFDSLCSFCYNVGSGGFVKSTLLKLINKNLLSEASNEFGKWVKAGGKTLSGLKRRREAERKMFTNGEYINNG